MVNNGRNWLLRSLRRAAFSGPAGLEIFLAITALVWGGLILLRFPVLIHNGNAVTILQRVAPYWFWAGLFFIFGGLQLTAVWHASYHWRARASFIGFMWWTFFTTIDALPVGIVPTSFMFIMYVVAQLFVYLLLSVIFAPTEDKRE